MTTTYLEMPTAPQAPPRPLPTGAEIRRAAPPSVPFYRWLYAQVGGPWRWTDRARLADAALEALVTPANVHVYVLYLHGTPAGYAELAFGPFDGTDRVAEGEAQIVYFGLMPHALGHGAGRAFLDWAIRAAFAHPIQRLWVHTCSDDHPRALGVYEAAGFVVYKTETAPA